MDEGTSLDVLYGAYVFVPSKLVSKRHLHPPSCVSSPNPRQPAALLALKAVLFVWVQSTTSSRPEPSIPTNLPRQFFVSHPLSPEWQTKMDMLLFLWLIVLGVMIVFAFAGILILMIPIIDPERAAQNANR